MILMLFVKSYEIHGSSLKKLCEYSINRLNHIAFYFATFAVSKRTLYRDQNSRITKEKETTVAEFLWNVRKARVFIYSLHNKMFRNMRARMKLLNLTYKEKKMLEIRIVEYVRTR